MLFCKCKAKSKGVDIGLVVNETFMQEIGAPSQTSYKHLLSFINHNHVYIIVNVAY